MNLEQALTKFTHHSETIIQWLFFAILLISGLLVARFLFSKKEAAGESPELSGALQKILEQTAKLESVSLDKMSAQGVASVDAQVQTLKADLHAREAEILKLKDGGGSSGKAAEEAAALSARIKELESKLSEYEILEDDIADLSLYKEENTRLRSEIERVKGGGAASAAGAAAATPAPASGDDIVAEFAQAVEGADAGLSEEDELAALLAPQIATQATIEVPDTGDPMADFESAVKAEKAAIGSATPAPAPAAPKAAPAPVAAPAPEAPSASGEADDLFAEFSSSTTEPAAEGADGALDTDKMMAEMAALVGMEPSADSALEEGIDTEKMALEASSFNKS